MSFYVVIFIYKKRDAYATHHQWLHYNIIIFTSGVTMKVFDRVKVLIQTEQSGPQHERVIMKLTEPAVEGLSVVSPME